MQISLWQTLLVSGQQYYQALLSPADRGWGRACMPLGDNPCESGLIYLRLALDQGRI